MLRVYKQMHMHSITAPSWFFSPFLTFCEWDCSCKSADRGNNTGTIIKWTHISASDDAFCRNCWPLVYTKQWTAAQKSLSCPLANYHIAGVSMQTAALAVLAPAPGMLAQKSLLQGQKKPSLDGRKEEVHVFVTFASHNQEHKLGNANGVGEEWWFC